MLGIGKKDKREEAAEKKMGKSEEKYLDLQADIKNKELELKNKDLEIRQREQDIDLTLAKLKQQHSLALDSEKHTMKLERETESAAFEREKKDWADEKIKMEKEGKEDDKRFQDKLKLEHEIEHKEAVSLLKLESQQEIAQAKLECDKKIQELESKQAKEKSEYQKTLQEDNYKAMQVALADMNKNGNAQGKFAQEFSMKMLEMVGTNKLNQSQIGLDASINFDSSPPKQSSTIVETAEVVNA